VIDTVVETCVPRWLLLLYTHVKSIKICIARSPTALSVAIFHSSNERKSLYDKDRFFDKSVKRALLSRISRAGATPTQAHLVRHLVMKLIVCQTAVIRKEKEGVPSHIKRVLILFCVPLGATCGYLDLSIVILSRITTPACWERQSWHEPRGQLGCALLTPTRHWQTAQWPTNQWGQQKLKWITCL